MTDRRNSHVRTVVSASRIQLAFSAPADPKKE